jgi:hypothetical protein
LTAVAGFERGKPLARSLAVRSRSPAFKLTLSKQRRKLKCL